MPRDRTEALEQLQLRAQAAALSLRKTSRALFVGALAGLFGVISRAFLSGSVRPMPLVAAVGILGGIFGIHWLLARRAQRRIAALGLSCTHCGHALVVPGVGRVEKQLEALNAGLCPHCYVPLDTEPVSR